MFLDGDGDILYKNGDDEVIVLGAAEGEKYSGPFSLFDTSTTVVKRIFQDVTLTIEAT